MGRPAGGWVSRNALSFGASTLANHIWCAHVVGAARQGRYARSVQASGRRGDHARSTAYLSPSRPPTRPWKPLLCERACITAHIARGAHSIPTTTSTHPEDERARRRGQVLPGGGVGDGRVLVRGEGGLDRSDGTEVGAGGCSKSRSQQQVPRTGCAPHPLATQLCTQQARPPARPPAHMHASTCSTP